MGDILLSNADREVVLAAVKEDGEALKEASDEHKSDREIVLAATQSCFWALKFASNELNADREFILEVVNSNGAALSNASNEMKADREIVLAALKQGMRLTSGSIFQYASDDLKADREFVLAAINIDDTALEYASDELKVELKKDGGENMINEKKKEGTGSITTELIEERKEETGENKTISISGIGYEYGVVDIPKNVYEIIKDGGFSVDDIEEALGDCDCGINIDDCGPMFEPTITINGEIINADKSLKENEFDIHENTEKITEKGSFYAVKLEKYKGVWGTFSFPSTFRFNPKKLSLINTKLMIGTEENALYKNICCCTDFSYESGKYGDFNEDDAELDGKSIEWYLVDDQGKVTPI